jgi:hypothetical protein
MKGSFWAWWLDEIDDGSRMRRRAACKGKRPESFKDPGRLVLRIGCV